MVFTRRQQSYRLSHGFHYMWQLVHVGQSEWQRKSRGHIAHDAIWHGHRRATSATRHSVLARDRIDRAGYRGAENGLGTERILKVGRGYINI